MVKQTRALNEPFPLIRSVLTVQKCQLSCCLCHFAFAKLPCKDLRTPCRAPQLPEKDSRMPAVTISSLLPPAVASVKSSATLRNLSHYHLENMFFVKRWLVEVFDDPVGGMQGEGGVLSGGHRWLHLYLIEWAIELGKGFFSHDGFTWRGKRDRLSRVDKFNQPWGMTDSSYANGAGRSKCSKHWRPCCYLKQMMAF